ncbi:MAG: trypsin-like peptidase domain-containing protein [Bacillota bacterium]
MNPIEWLRGKKIVVLAFALGIMVTFGVLYGAQVGIPHVQLAGAEEAGNQQASLTGSLPGVSANSIADIVQKAGPAVVKIDTTVQNSSSNPYFQDPFFRQFFGNDPSQQGTQEEKGLGSGMIISKDGYILTNEHVVHGATDIEVTVVGYDKPFKAKVVGADYDLDLALLKIIPTKDLVYLTIGDSDKIEAGNWVIAIGNPYGLDHTVTVGVISAKGRPVSVEDREYKNLLQTDASINPGNSGGPLLDLQGEVIGINTAINAQAQGIGFAIPTSTVKEVLDDLRNNVKVAHPYIGVMAQEMTPDIAQYLGLDKTEGALIAYVDPGSPAAKAGIKRGDVVLKVDQTVVSTPDDLSNAIKGKKVGQKIVALVNRYGRSSNFTITIGDKNLVQQN